MKRIQLVILGLILCNMALGAENGPATEADTDSLTVLEEIVVKAPLINRESDRIVLNVAANPLSADKDAHELLKTAPGVWATDDDLSINGQGGTAVYVDDRKVNMSGSRLMTYLKSIQSSSIATIEIIPKAGAEYSADASGGVIRINLKRNRVDGINGSSGLSVTAGEYKQWLNPFLNLSLHSGKWTLNLNGNLNGSPADKYTSYRETMNNTLSQHMSGVSYHRGKTIQGNVSLGLFYAPTGRDKIGLQFDYNPDRSHHVSNSGTDAVGDVINGLTSGRYLSEDLFHNFNATLNWTRSIDDEGSLLKIITNYNYQSSSVREANEMHYDYLQQDSVYKTANSNRYNVFVAEMSVNKILNPGWSLNLGAKYTFNGVSNKSYHHYLKGSEWVADKGFDYDTSYKENIAAVYAIAKGTAGRWKFKGGARGEFSKTVGGVTYNGGFDVFPTVNVSYDITGTGDYTVAAGYFRNIRRPSFWSLNPVVRQTADYTYSVGNPRLTPSFTDGVSLDFLLARKFTVAAGYSRTRHPIRQMFVSNPEYPERLYLTWGNEGTDRNAYIHADGFIDLTSWWNLYSSVTYVLTSRKLTETEPFETFGYIRLTASTTFRLPKGWNLTVSCFYNSRMNIGNITVYPLLQVNPTLQKRFGRHWSVSVGVEDLLQRRNVLRTLSSGYDQLSYSRSHMAGKVSVTYSFSNGKSFTAPRIEKNADASRLTKE